MTGLSIVEATPLALNVHSALVPVAERVQVVGALRRRTAPITSIEVVVAPKRTLPDLLGKSELMVAEIVDACERIASGEVAVSKWRLVFGVSYRTVVAGEPAEDEMPVHVQLVDSAAVTWAWVTLAATGPVAYVDYVRKGLASRYHGAPAARVLEKAVIEPDGTPLVETDEVKLCQGAGVTYVDPKGRPIWQKLIKVAGD